jgi:hypothetical protein
MKGVNHYTKDGKIYRGGTHKHPGGGLMSGKTMTKKSIKLYHFSDLSESAKRKARLQWRKGNKK